MLFELISVALVALTALYFYVKGKHSYWKNKHIPHNEPTFTKGSLETVGTKFSLFEVMEKHYRQFKGKAPFFGFYFFTDPVAVATDINFVKTVMTSDNGNFINRGVYYNEVEDPLSAHLFSIDSPKWKTLRTKLTPTFTSGKMKMMFGTIVDVANKFISTLEIESKNVQNYEIKEILVRFTTDVIGSCAFGLECNSLEHPTAEFREMGKKAIHNPITVRLMFLQSFKNIGRRLKMKFIPDDVANFFLRIVKDTISFRETNSIVRNDFMNLLIQMKNKGEIDSDTGEAGKKIITGKLTVEEIAAQAFVFFLAGFETSSTAMTYCLYELAMNQNLQDKARESARTALKNHNGNFTYEAVMDMNYIEQCIYESLRKYPAVTDLSRVAERDYKIEGTDHTIKAGTKIFIPVFAIHHDPEYYPNPDKYDPERFTAAENKNRNPYTFLGFGEGPRNCIGLRFGVLQAKIGMALMLTNFKFEVCEKTEIPIKYDKAIFLLLVPSGGVHLKITKI